METKYFTVDQQQPDRTVLAAAAEILASGGLVAFPTETVYGLGANGLDSGAVERIFQAKGRPADNPLILHIASSDDVQDLAEPIPANAKVLMDKFWPGPLTVVLRRKPLIPDAVTGGLDTVALRLPDSLIAREIIALSGCPIAAPSANVSGRPSPTTAAAVMADLDGKIDAVVDGGACAIGLESTVVDCTTVVPTLLRPGGITLEMLEETLGEVEIDQSLAESQAVPRSPGMKYVHYAPAAPMVLIEGSSQAVTEAIISHVHTALRQGKKVGAAVSSETAALLPTAAITAVYGNRGDVNAAAANLYEVLRSFDKTDVDIIYGEGISEEGLGLAVMNRLRKASGYRILRVK